MMRSPARQLPRQTPLTRIEVEFLVDYLQRKAPQEAPLDLAVAVIHEHRAVVEGLPASAILQRVATRFGIRLAIEDDPKLAD